jgi:hypothetical protein
MKILCILDDDSKNEIPVRFAKGDIPKLENYPDGMLPPSPRAIDLIGGE